MSYYVVLEDFNTKKKLYDKSEDDIIALQSVGQMIGEVLKQLTEDKFIVKSSSGPRHVVGCRPRVKKEDLKPGTRVAMVCIF